jgi:glycosyltransferase involved in cell wall biosynthesis
VKIAIFSPTNPYIDSGATNNITGLKAGLEGIGHEVFLIGFRKFLGDRKLETRKKTMKNVILVPYYNIVPRKRYALRDFFDRRWQMAATRRLKELLKREKIDIIILRFAYYPYFTIRAVRKDFGGRIAVLSYPLVAGQSQLGRIPKHLADEMRVLEKLSLQEADKILAYSPPVADIIVKEYGIDRKKIAITRPGSDFERFRSEKKDVRAKMGWDGKYIIGFIGSLAMWQGLEYLIESMQDIVKKNKNALLVIIGYSPDAAYRQKLEKTVAKLDLEKFVKFYEPVPHDEVPRYLNSLDVFAAPYAKTDPPMSIVFPIKLAEALATGSRIVTTDQSGLSWVITDGVNGMLAKPNDPASLAGKITEVMENRELSGMISENARKTAERFDWKIIAKEAVESIMFDDGEKAKGKPV